MIGRGKSASCGTEVDQNAEPELTGCIRIRAIARFDRGSIVFSQLVVMILDVNGLQDVRCKATLTFGMLPR
jgi:hypothetical protein